MGTRGYPFSADDGYRISEAFASSCMLLVQIRSRLPLYWFPFLLCSSTSLTTDGYHLLHSSDGSHGWAPLSNSTTKPDAAIVELYTAVRTTFDLTRLALGLQSYG